MSPSKPRVSPRRLAEVAVLDAALAGGGLVLFLNAGQLAWVLAGALTGAAATVLLLVLPLLNATRDREGNRLVE